MGTGQQENRRYIHWERVREFHSLYSQIHVQASKNRKNDEYGRQREFRLMSKGMGAAYITDQMKRWHLQDLGNRMYIPLMDGKKIAMPRYYKDRIYTEKQRKIAGKMLQKQLQELEEKIRQETPDFEDFMMNKKEAIINKFNYRSKTRQKL